MLIYPANKQHEHFYSPSHTKTIPIRAEQQQKVKAQIIKHSIQPEQNKRILYEGYTLFTEWCYPFNKMATPFRPKGVAILQITSFVFRQMHHLFGVNRPCICLKQMIRFKKKEDSLRWKKSSVSNVC